MVCLESQSTFYFCRPIIVITRLLISWRRLRYVQLLVHWLLFKPEDSYFAKIVIADAKHVIIEERIVQAVWLDFI